MKLIKVKANINGSCEGYVFSMDQVLELPENVVRALGSDVTVLEEVTEKTEEKEEQPEKEKVEEKTETKEKEVKEKKDKMVQKTNVITK